MTFSTPNPPVTLPAQQPAVTAATYVDVAQKLLMSSDRNPTVIVEQVQAKPMPPLPRAYGAMDFGAGPRVVLALKPAGEQRSYAVGEVLGEFKVLAITQAGVVFEWEKKTVAATYSELRDDSKLVQTAAQRTPSAQGSAAAQPAAPPAAPAEAKSIVSDSSIQGKPGPGSGSTRPCAKGDTSPFGTVSDGYKKAAVDTPMGQGCFWQKEQ